MYLVQIHACENVFGTNRIRDFSLIQKEKKRPDWDLNPGLPRDRRGYLTAILSSQKSLLGVGFEPTQSIDY